MNYLWVISSLPQNILVAIESRGGYPNDYIIELAPLAIEPNIVYDTEDGSKGYQNHAKQVRPKCHSLRLDCQIRSRLRSRRNQSKERSLRPPCFPQLLKGQVRGSQGIRTMVSKFINSVISIFLLPSSIPPRSSCGAGAITSVT